MFIDFLFFYKENESLCLNSFVIRVSGVVYKLFSTHRLTSQVTTFTPRKLALSLSPLSLSRRPLYEDPKRLVDNSVFGLKTQFDVLFYFLGF